MFEHVIVEYGLFLLKVATVVGAVIVIALALKSKKEEDGGDVELTNLTDKYHEMQQELDAEIFGEKEAKKRQKEKQKKQSESSDQKRLFVLTYDGDVEANAVEALREEITAIILLHQEGDEVLLKLESPGGVVNGYGLAASQLQRLKNHGIHLTIAVDRVAASGGYMMACVGHKIVAAPFSVIGSIGVVAEVPNIHRLLKKHDIDVDIMTAGQYKRTVTFLGENTVEGKEKFAEELQTTHELFKQFVSANRPQLNIDDIATGEIWYGTQAKELKLIDEISTSDDILLQAVKTKQVYALEYKQDKTLIEKIGRQLELSVAQIVSKLVNKNSKII